MVPMFSRTCSSTAPTSGAIAWGDEVPDDVKAASPVVVIGCGESGILAGIRLTQAGLPFTIVEKNDGPGGTWWENRYPGARVDVGSHQYCYSFEPAHHWSEYYCQQPELRDYFARVRRQVRTRAALPLRHHRHVARWDERQLRGRSGSATPTAPRRSSRRGSSSAPSVR